MADQTQDPQTDRGAKRRVQATFFMSLDGVVEDPAWTASYWNDEIAAFKGQETDKGQELLLGRVTYEQFAHAWPQSDDDGAQYFNGARKHVVSTTLTEDIWQNADFISKDIAQAVGDLKSRPGGDLVVHGSISLARWLIAQGLVDELRILVYPVVLGAGRRLFDGGGESSWKLESSKAMENGVVALVYSPKRNAT